MDHKEILREDLLKVYRAIEFLDEAIFITDINGIITYINSGFTNLYGYTDKEVTGKTPRILESGSLEPDDNNYFWNTIPDNKVVRRELINTTKDGKLLTIEELANPILDGYDKITGFVGIHHDITIRKLAEKAFEREQYFMDALMNNLADYIYIKDTESRFLKINKSHAFLLGLDDPDQVIGKTDYDFYSKEDAQLAHEEEKSIVLTGITINEEEKLVVRGQSDKWAFATKMPLFDHEGNIIGTFGISKDITEKKNLEDALHLKQIQLEAIIRNSPDQIYYKDRNSKFIFCNAPVALLAGCASEKDIIGKSDFDFYPHHLAQQYFNDEQTLMEMDQPFLNHEEPILDNQTGELRWNLSSKVPVKDANGKVIGLVGFNRDITDRKKSDMERQVNYEITQGITTTSNLDELLKLIHTSLAKVVYAENCFVALHNEETGLFSFPYFVDKLDSPPLPSSTGKSCTAYVFRTVKPLLLTQDAFDKLAEQDEVKLVGSHSASWIGIPLQTPSKVLGVLVLQHYEKNDVYSERDVQFLVSIGSQIAMAIERKKAEEEILLKNELLQASNVEKDKFFSIIAHDLRGPLSSFVAASQIITEEIQAMSIEEIKAITISIKTSATSIYSLLENLLEWSRLRRGGFDFIPEMLNLERRVSTSIEVLSESARQKGIELEISIPTDIYIFADNNMTDAIIRNLVSNAIKFSNSGSKIHISAAPGKNNFVEVKISDTGIGMTWELQSKMFLMNEKTSRPGTAGELSTGLGLLLCKEFVEKHNGKIWVESEVGKGSTFYFTLPTGV
jgi:PAS domain S-box-containing protein